MDIRLKSKYDTFENEYKTALLNLFSLSGKHHEKEVLELLTSKSLTTNDIGKIVILNNNATDCNEWIISRINEDNTVDLFPKYVLNNSMKFGDTNVYKDSNIREWLNGEFLNGFSDDVKNAMKVQSFESNDEILEDKVKCPSLNEVGLTYSSDYLLPEDTVYPIFGNSLINGTNSLSAYITTNGGGMEYWTRSRDTGDSCHVWLVHSDGYRSINASVFFIWGCRLH